MGNQTARSTEELEISSITVEYDQASPSCTGLTSVLSQPLEEYIDYDGLWYGLVRLIKDPPKHGLLTKSVCTDVSPTEFNTRSYFTVGPVGALLGFEDFETTENCVLDYEKGDITTKRYDQTETLVQTTCNKIHKEPLRVESWIEVPSDRIASRAIGILASDALTRGRKKVNPAAEGEGEIVVHHDHESLSGDGQRSVVSDPLDDHFESLDQLWEGWIAAAKQSPLDNPQQQDANMPKVTSFEVKEISESEFNIITVIDGESLDRGFDLYQRVATPVDSLLAFHGKGDRMTISVYICDRSKAELCNQIFNHLGQLVMTIHARFYEDPLRAEVWAEQAKGRKSGRVHCVMVWTFLSQVIKEFRKASAAAHGQVVDGL